MADSDLTGRADRLAEDQLPATLALLEWLVNTDSFSRDPAGVDRVGDRLIQELTGLGFQVERLPAGQPGLGRPIQAVLPGPQPGRLLLLGHMDTVFPPGTAAARPFTSKDGRLYGPGVADMKGGLALVVAALHALLTAGWTDRPTLEVLFTPDEEIGSPGSRALIQERARAAAAVFNVESGRPDGSVVVQRKGSAHLELRVEGRAAHSGTSFEKGISAVAELAHKIVAIHALTDLEQGVTFNVGVVEGGTNTNVIAAAAMARIHVAFRTEEQAYEALAQLRAIAAHAYVPGTRSTLTGGIGFLPMSRHAGVERLFALVLQAAQQVGLAVGAHSSPGAADSGWTASAGAPTVCGMGIVGGNWHSAEEYAELTTFPQRIRLLAHALLLAAGQAAALRGDYTAD